MTPYGKKPEFPSWQTLGPPLAGGVICPPNLASGARRSDPKGGPDPPQKGGQGGSRGGPPGGVPEGGPGPLKTPFLAHPR